MSVERDTGFQALQSGDTAAAIEQLERATQHDPSDYLAHLYLGAAYGKADRHSDAITVLTQAVQLQPSSAQARYNLGIALERAGWREQALGAVQQALQLQAEYPLAKEAEQRLQPPIGFAAPALQPAEAQSGYAPAPQAYADAPPQPGLGYTPPSGTLPPQPTIGYTPPGAAPPPGYNQPYAAPRAGDLTGGGGGLNQTQGYPAPAYNQPQPVGQPAPYGAGGPPRAGYGAGTFSAPVEDRFDLVQAVRDWVQIIVSPRKFFQGQIGREGMAAPLSFMILTVILGIVGLGISFAQHAAQSVNPLLLPIVIGTAIFLFVWPFIYAGVLQLVGSMFGNSAPYSGTFRAVVYANGPSWMMSLLAALLVLATGSISAPTAGRPTGPGSSTTRPYGYSGASSFPSATATSEGPGAVIAQVINLASIIWVVVLLVMGLSAIQQISGGAAFGEIFISGILLVVLLVVVIIVVSVVFGVALAGAMKSGAFGR